MRTRNNVIDDLYEIDLVEEGTRCVAVWGIKDDGSEDRQEDIPTYILAITHEGYEKMKKDLEEFHNMLKWMNDNPESQVSYGMWDTVRLLKL
jgi:hypothetical protein